MQKTGDLGVAGLNKFMILWWNGDCGHRFRAFYTCRSQQIIKIFKAVLVTEEGPVNQVFVIP